MNINFCVPFDSWFMEKGLIYIICIHYRQECIENTNGYVYDTPKVGVVLFSQFLCCRINSQPHSWRTLRLKHIHDLLIYNNWWIVFRLRMCQGIWRILFFNLPLAPSENLPLAPSEGRGKKTSPWPPPKEGGYFLQTTPAPPLKKEGKSNHRPWTREEGWVMSDGGCGLNYLFLLRRDNSKRRERRAA